jgi:hypothetical protein
MTRGLILPFVLRGVYKTFKQSAELVLNEVVIEIALIPFDGFAV